MSAGKQLLLDSRAYAQEQRLTSWWCLLSTLVLFIGLQMVIAMADLLWLRFAASALVGLVMVRLFIIYHDFEHGTILKHSWFAAAVLKTYGILTLNPPSIWKRSHDHHHKHNAKLYGSGIGTFPIMTVAEYKQATARQRLAYRLIRHPLTFIFGYLTVFLYGMCIRSLFINPRLHWDSAVALVVHVGLLIFTASFGWDLMLLAIIFPAMLSAMIGSYLFYAQHNYPKAKLSGEGQWNYIFAALESSSYMKMNPVMHWFTGNIGYHHIHHLNHHIPFYRLPEAMAGLPATQSPGTTSLSPPEVIRCLRLGAWDAVSGRMVN